MDSSSVGIVEVQYFSFAASPNEMALDSGEKLGPITLAYETYGTLNERGDNAILLCHALSGDSHVAGYYSETDRKPGWWDFMIGPGCPFDTDKYYVVCSNVIGGCKGSTGPGSLHPKTGEPYCLDFPLITVGDIVDAQKKLLDHLGIQKLYSIAGGSFGGFQVLEWTLRYPEMVRSAVCIASSSKLSVQAIAFNAVGRHAITSDPGWMDGRYYGTPGPVQGLAIARMVGHITYLSDLSMDSKFGRRLKSADRFSYDFTTDFEVESYLKYKGYSFTERFDANSYLYISKAMDYFDVTRNYGQLIKAFAGVMSKYLIISYSSDWLFTTEQSKEIVRALLYNDRDVSFIEIDSPYGHDAFLIEHEQISKIITPFLDNVEKY